MGSAPLDDVVADLRRERALAVLYPLFFASGATALVYQTLWSRQLHHVFGTSSFAISTVLAAFMAGQALGGWLAGKRADDLQRPLRMYGLFEVGIGLYALIFPVIVRWITPLYLEFWRQVEPGPVSFGLLQFLLIGVALLLPTAAMGATLPILARFATRRLGAAGSVVGLLYGINTAGAVLGTFLGGFVLLPAWGLWATTLGAACMNLLLGGLALVTSQSAGEGAGPLPVEEDTPRLPPRPGARVVLAVAALSGFAALIYEVAWTRLLVLMLGASVYAFSVMLLAFLVGIAAGGAWGGGPADRLWRRFGERGVLGALALCQVGIAGVTYLTLYSYGELPFWYVWLFDRAAEGGTSAGGVWMVSLVLSGLVMTPAAFGMGAVFPLAVRALVGDPDKLGAPVGSVYSSNTIGSMVGATLAGFVLLPGIGVQGAVFVGAAANVVAGGLCLWRMHRIDVADKRPLGALGALAVLGFVLGFVAQRPPWDPMVMTAGMYKYVSSFSDHSREGIRDYAIDRYELLYYDEGLSSVVTVARSRESQNIWLANNGKVDASTTVDMPTQVLVSLLPMQFVEDPAEVLVIGLASGITAGAVTLVDDAEHIEVVELEPSILEAARFFDEWNHGVLDDPRVELVANDGRNHVLLAEPGAYDVIISEPSNPWISGVSNLFTREFLEIGKSRLAPGGVWAQWVQAYGMGPEDVRSLVATFADVYPYVLLYATVEEADLVLIGSETPIQPDIAHARQLLERWPRASAELATIDIAAPLDLVARFQMDRSHLVEMSEGADINTDDNMRIEYSAPLYLHEETTEDNFAMLLKHREVPFEAIGRDGEQLASLARVYRRREDWVRAIKAMAVAAKLAPEGSELQEARYLEAELWQRELIEASEKE